MVEDALCDILRKRASHALAQCGNESGSDSTAIIPADVRGRERHGRGLVCGKPPGPARGRGSPPKITTAIAVNCPMTTLVVMTALPPLIAFGTHPERSALPASSTPA